MKISKSDLVLPRAEEDVQRAAQAAKPRPKSRHFEVGTFVIVGRERAEVIARPGNGWMLVRYEDQTTEILKPFALAHEHDAVVDSDVLVMAGTIKCPRSNTNYF